MINCDFRIDECNSAEIINLNKNRFYQKNKKLSQNFIDLYLSIDDIGNLDYISNTFNFQLTMLEIFKDIQNISNTFSIDDNEISLINKNNYRWSFACWMVI